jgi:hypothetical protein
MGPLAIGDGADSSASTDAAGNGRAGGVGAIAGVLGYTSEGAVNPSTSTSRSGLRGASGRG